MIVTINKGNPDKKKLWIADIFLKEQKNITVLFSLQKLPEPSLLVLCFYYILTDPNSTFPLNSILKLKTFFKTEKLPELSSYLLPTRKPGFLQYYPLPWRATPKFPPRIRSEVAYSLYTREAQPQVLCFSPPCWLRCDIAMENFSGQRGTGHRAGRSPTHWP